MPNNSDAIQEAMRMAQSPAGQQLLRLLQQGNSQALQQAMNSAASGDYESAKKALSTVLNDPQAQKLLRQMGGNHGSDGR